MAPAPELNELPKQNPLKLSEIVKTAADNNVIAFQIRIQLESLQSWIRQQESLYNNK